LAGHFSGLPVNNGRGYEGETATGVELLVNFPGTDATPLGKEDVSGELVELFDLEKALADALPELRLGKVFEQEFGLDEPPEVPVCPVEMVFVVVGHEAFERDGCGGVSRF